MKRIYEDFIPLLRRGITNGWWTLEDLDTPPPGWAYTNRMNDRHDCQHLRVPPRLWTNPLREEHDTF